MAKLNRNIPKYIRITKEELNAIKSLSEQLRCSETELLMTGIRLLQKKLEELPHNSEPTLNKAQLEM